jgi:hypothetical protein
MSELVTIHAGPIWEVELLKGRLEQEGIVVFLPEANVKRVDPFITGGNALDTKMQVPEHEAERARVLVEEYREATREKPAEFTDAVDPDARMARKAKLGRRIRWLTLLWFTAPIALVLGILYVWDLEPNEPRPPSHGLTMAAILIAVLGTLFWMFVILFAGG